MASPKRHYFIDIMLAETGNYYLRISRSDLLEDGRYARTSVVIFEDSFPLLISAFSAAFRSLAYHGQGFQTLKDIATGCRARGSMKSMPEADRPRERLFNQGSAALTDCELLAILLGAGSPGERAIDLAARILAGHGGVPSGLLRSNFPSLCRFKGMGMAKASSVLAAIELSRRIYCGQTRLF